MESREPKTKKLITKERKVQNLARKFLKKQVPLIDLQMAWAEMESQKEKIRK